MMIDDALPEILACSTSGHIAGSSALSKDTEERKDANNDDGDANDSEGVLFIRKLYELVSQESDEIVRFRFDGSSFEIKDSKRLEAEVLPKYFKQTRFHNFVRRLLYFKFNRVSELSSEESVYRHDLFHRDKPELLDNLKRQSTEAMVPPLPLRRTISTSDQTGAVGGTMRRTASDSNLQGFGGSVWREVVDATSEQVYYWNTFTGHIQWEKPPDYRRHEEVDFVKGMPPRSVETTSPKSASPKRSRVPPSPPPKQPLGLSASGGGPHNRSESSIDSNSNKRLCSSNSGGGPKPSSGFEPTAGKHYHQLADLCSAGGKDKALAWEAALQISNEALGALQRALYERGTSPALVALVTFGIRTTPFQGPSELLTAVRAKLNSHNDLWDELKRYREALEPKTQCLEQLTVRAMYTVQGETPSDSKARLKSETMMIREFMSFVVTRLQTVHDVCETHDSPLEPEQQRVLASCLHLWWNHANTYL